MGGVFNGQKLIFWLFYSQQLISIFLTPNKSIRNLKYQLFKEGRIFRKFS